MSPYNTSFLIGDNRPMTEDDESRPTGRRQFFRHLLARTIEGVEQAGRQMQQARGWSFHDEEAAPDPDLSHGGLGGEINAFRPEYRYYGPPWPPRLGPEVPQQLRQKWKAQRDRTVSR